MTDENTVVLTGTINQRPDYSETGDGHPRASFFLTVRRGHGEHEDVVRVTALGHAANSIRRYWYPTVFVSITGQLHAFPGEHGSVMYVSCQQIGYLSISSILKNELRNARSA